MPTRCHLAVSVVAPLLALAACHPQPEAFHDTTPVVIQPARSENAWSGLIANVSAGSHRPFPASSAAVQVDSGYPSCSNKTGMPFCTIQAAIDAAPDGSTISVTAGVYTGTLDITGRNGLSIVGVGRDSVTLQPTTTLPWNVAGYGDTRRTAVRVVNSTGISLSGITFDFVAVAANSVYGVLYWDSTGTLENDRFSNMSVPDSAGGYYEYTVYARAPGYNDSSRASLTVRNNLFVEAGRIGVMAHGYVDALIQGNTFNKSTRDFGYAIELGSQAIGVIRSNRISGNDLPAAVDGSSSAGIYIENAFTVDGPASLKPVLIEGNDIQRNQYGAIIGNDYPGLSGNVDIRVTMKNNDVHDNTQGGVYVVDSGRNNGSSVNVVAQGNRIRHNGAFGYDFSTDGDGELHASLADEVIEFQTESTRVDDSAGATSGSLYDVTIQSATSASAGQTVTFDVIAREPQSASPSFSWSTNTGSLSAPQTTATTSRVVWTAPSCALANVIPSVTAVVTNAYSLSGSRSFSVSGLPTCSGWSNAAPMRSPRLDHTATLLKSGKVLIAGGRFSFVYLASAELYDPATNSWSPAGKPEYALSGSTATLLPSGKVLVAGGEDGYGPSIAVELYDPATNSWSIAPSMFWPRAFHAATPLPSGKVLVMGGGSDTSETTSSAELYDPATNTWSPAAPMKDPRRYFTATQLNSGKVIAIGGNFTYLDETTGDYIGRVNSNAEWYDPATNLWTWADNPNPGRAFHTATLLSSGKLLVSGGTSIIGPLSSAALFNPSWSSASSMSHVRHQHAATLLQSGKVLVVGGLNQDNAIDSSAELYDPASNSWTSAGSMAFPRKATCATLLPSGQVLITGGMSTGLTATSSAELYTP